MTESTGFCLRCLCSSQQRSFPSLYVARLKTKNNGMPFYVSFFCYICTSDDLKKKKKKTRTNEKWNVCLNSSSLSADFPWWSAGLEALVLLFYQPSPLEQECRFEGETHVYLFERLKENLCVFIKRQCLHFSGIHVWIGKHGH